MQYSFIRTKHDQMFNRLDRLGLRLLLVMTRFGVAEFQISTSDPFLVPISFPLIFPWCSSFNILNLDTSQKKNRPCSDDEQGPMKRLEDLLRQNN
jgi:hypothetical protein